MKMTFRWYGSQMDPIPLRYIKQIPNMSGVVSSLMDLPAGALWPTERIQALKQEVQDAGLELEVIESVNVHEDIKLGLPGRDAYIDRYRTTIERLGQAGVKVICYNFMPVFDWTRSDLFKPRADGSLDLYEIMKAYSDIGFEGYIRPDHGRMIWDEKGRAGYGLYDRALGVAYLNGLWEAIQKDRR